MPQVIQLIGFLIQTNTELLESDISIQLAVTYLG